MIRFTYGTQTAYDSLEFKDPDVLYCITDTMRIYKGTDLISDTCVKFIETVPTAETAVSGNLYVYAAEGQTPALYVKVGNEVVQVPSGSSSIPTIDQVLEQTNGVATRSIGILKSSGEVGIQILSGTMEQPTEDSSYATVGIVGQSSSINSTHSAVQLEASALDSKGDTRIYSTSLFAGPQTHTQDDSAGLIMHDTAMSMSGTSMTQQNMTLNTTRLFWTGGESSNSGVFIIPPYTPDDTEMAGFILCREGYMHKALTGDLEDTLLDDDQVNMRSKLDVYSKSEVDSMVSGGGTPTGNCLPLTGGTMTGTIDMGSNPITATQSSGTIQPNHLMTFGIFAETLAQMPEMFMGKSGSVWNADGSPVAAIPDLPDSPSSQTYGNYAVNLNSLNSILQDKAVLKSGGQTLTGTYEFNSSTPGNHVLSLIDLSGSSGEVFYLDGRGGIHCTALYSEGSIQVNNSKIGGVATPLEDTDAANKQYVDTAVSSQVSALQSQIDAITQTLASLNISVAEI